MSGVSRRTMLAGIGAAAAGAGGLAFAPAASALTVSRDNPFGSGGATPSAGAQVRAGITLTPGLAYERIDAADLSGEPTAPRLLGLTGAQPMPAAPANILFGAPRLPVGAVLKEIAISYLNPAGAMSAELWKMADSTGYAMLATTPLAAGAAAQTATMSPTVPQSATDGAESYMVLLQFSAATQFVRGLLVGYVPPARAFVALPAVQRVLDTRTTGGKLNPNEERVIALGVPGFARAAVINITVTDTEVAGFVAVFAANVPYPGNSTINWSATGQILANSAITAVDPSGQIKIRGGVNRTHVVIDVQGYLL